MASPVLATKLYIPPPPPKTIVRTRLIERLDEGLLASRKSFPGPYSLRTDVMRAYKHRLKSSGVTIGMGASPGGCVLNTDQKFQQ